MLPRCSASMLTRSAPAVMQTLVDLSQRLGLKSVAEWVPNEETAALLAEWGCDCLQGALIGLAHPSGHGSAETIKPLPRNLAARYSLPPILSSRRCISSS